eukprot:g48791.t1
MLTQHQEPCQYSKLLQLSHRDGFIHAYMRIHTHAQFLTLRLGIPKNTAKKATEKMASAAACEECEGKPKPATINCPECGQHLCEECDKWLHCKGKLARHVRQPAKQSGPHKSQARWLKCSQCVCGEFFKEFSPAPDNPSFCAKCNHHIDVHEDMDRRGASRPGPARAIQPLIRRDRTVEEQWHPPAAESGKGSRSKASLTREGEQAQPEGGIHAGPVTTTGQSAEVADASRTRFQTPTNPLGIVVGDKITVKISVSKPKLGWGRVRHGDVGEVKWTDGVICHVQFPNRKLWKGTLSEMDIVDSDIPLFSSEPGRISPLGVGPGANAAKKAASKKEKAPVSQKPGDASNPNSPKHKSQKAPVSQKPGDASNTNSPKHKSKPVSAWRAIQTPEGEEYYWNQETNLTTWDKPDELKTEEEKAKDNRTEVVEALTVEEHPWKAIQTPEGEEYYWNQVTNETRWEKPPELMTGEGEAKRDSGEMNGHGEEAADTDSADSGMGMSRAEGEMGLGNFPGMMSPVLSINDSKALSPGMMRSPVLMMHHNTDDLEDADHNDEQERVKAERDRLAQEAAAAKREAEEAKARGEEMARLAAQKAEEEALKKAQSEIEKVRAEAARLREEMERHKREAEEARKEAERIQIEVAQKARAEAEAAAKTELAKQIAETERLRKEAEQAKAEAIEAKLEAKRANSRISRVNSRKDIRKASVDEDVPPPPPPPADIDDDNMSPRRDAHFPPPPPFPSAERQKASLERSLDRSGSRQQAQPAPAAATDGEKSPGPPPPAGSLTGRNEKEKQNEKVQSVVPTPPNVKRGLASHPLAAPLRKGGLAGTRPVQINQAAAARILGERGKSPKTGPPDANSPLSPGQGSRPSVGLGGGSRPSFTPLGGGSRPTLTPRNTDQPVSSFLLSPPPPPASDNLTSTEVTTTSHAPSDAGITSVKSEIENVEVLCEDCEEQAASFWCEECEQKLCGQCDKNFHRRGKRKDHIRVPLSSAHNSNLPTKKHTASSLATAAAAAPNHVFTYGEAGVPPPPPG